MLLSDKNIFNLKNLEYHSFKLYFIIKLSWLLQFDGEGIERSRWRCCHEYSYSYTNDKGVQAKWHADIWVDGKWISIQMNVRLHKNYFV